jgi:nucleoside-diphosphate-sugar epimerase
MEYPEIIETEEKLDAVMSEPSPNLIGMMRRIAGDIMILGASGKMGVQLGMMARKAADKAEEKRRIIGVSRFTDRKAREKLESSGVETLKCDLLDLSALQSLPEAANIIFMVGRKFGTTGSEGLTWAVNGITPAFVCEKYRNARIVAYSTGCVYDFADIASGGSNEEDDLNPVGEYAQTALARERAFEFFSEQYDIPVCLFRLNYSIDLRYGVLYDIGSKVFQGIPIDLTTGVVNIIWQGDAVERSLLCLEHCKVPAYPLNVTGPETLSVRSIADTFGTFLKKKPRFTGQESRTALISNASKSFELFGYPRVSVSRMIRWTAHWIKEGKPALSKPTHFDERKGEF